jgi:hypothetical protein
VWGQTSSRVPQDRATGFRQRSRRRRRGRPRSRAGNDSRHHGPETRRRGAGAWLSVSARHAGTLKAGRHCCSAWSRADRSRLRLASWSQHDGTVYSRRFCSGNSVVSSRRVPTPLSGRPFSDSCRGRELITGSPGSSRNHSGRGHEPDPGNYRAATVSMDRIRAHDDEGVRTPQRQRCTAAEGSAPRRSAA